MTGGASKYNVRSAVARASDTAQRPDISTSYPIRTFRPSLTSTTITGRTLYAGYMRIC